MKAIILAAGVGMRLGPIAETTPKALLQIGGKTLIERHFETLGKVGIDEIVIVVGHLKEMLEEKINSLEFDKPFRFVFNPRYKEGSMVSLWQAREELSGGALVMDADVLCPDNFLSILVNSKHESCFLMDSSKQFSGEEMMLSAKDGRVSGISRRGMPDVVVREPQSNDETGEGVGFLKVGASHASALVEIIERFVSNGKTDADYEDALNEWLKMVPVGYESVSGMLWTEIDFPEDIKKAEGIVEIIDH